MRNLRVIFMGTPAFACPTLSALLEAGHQVVAVYTQPDRPKGRGQKLMPPPVKELAQAHGIPVHQPKRVRAPEVLEEIKTLAPDLIVVVAFGQILPQALLDIPAYGCVNVHASLLPRYRGAAPLNWCLLNGEHETGITTMLMDAGLDTGPMLLKATTAILPDDTIITIHDRLAAMGGPLLLETVTGLLDGSITPSPQNDDESCYAPLLTKEHGLINWNSTATAIHNQIRALMVWPGAYTSLNNAPLKVFASRVTEHRGRPGEVLACGKEGLEVACGDGALLITELQAAGGKRLAAFAYLAGHPIAIGTILGAELPAP